MKRNILKQADETINAARPDTYGSVEESFEKIANILSNILGPDDFYAYNSPNGEQKLIVTPEFVAKTLISMKLVRDSYSPKNPDHLLDAAGYIGLLDQLRQGPEIEVEIPEAGEAWGQIEESPSEIPICSCEECAVPDCKRETCTCDFGDCAMCTNCDCARCSTLDPDQCHCTECATDRGEEILKRFQRTTGECGGCSTGSCEDH